MMGTMNMASIAMRCTTAATVGVIEVGLAGCTSGEWWAIAEYQHRLRQLGG